MQEVTRSIRKTGPGLCCVSALQSLHAGLFDRPDNARTLDPDSIPEAPVFIMDLDGTPLRREDINGVIGDTARKMYHDGDDSESERAKAFRSHSRRHGGASAYFLESIFIDQATLNGTRPISPAGVKPA